MTATLLAGCATSGSKVEVPAPMMQPAIVPAIPADIAGANVELTNLPDRALTIEETERYWKTDRARFVKLRSYFNRLRCQAAAVRREVGKVESQWTCHAPSKRGKA